VSAQERIEAANAKKAAAEARQGLLQEEFDADFAEQEAIDFDALVALQEEHGIGRIEKVSIDSWKQGIGAATMVVCRVPLASESYFRRFEQTISKKDSTVNPSDAGRTLARSCQIYPSEKAQPELYKATMNLADGALSKLAVLIVNAVQGRADEEKKG